MLGAGDLLSPARIGALAATGVERVEVFARPRVALLSTGNEIVAPGEPLGPGQIYDINKVTLASVVAEHGGHPVLYRTAVDRLDELSRAVDECLAQDVLVFSGGSSVGERDLILDVITAKGEILFHGIAVKPGKPTVFGVVNGKAVFGMPGYPTSCLSNAYMLLVPALRRMAHLPPYQARTIQLPVAQRIVSTTGLRPDFASASGASVRGVENALRMNCRFTSGVTIVMPSATAAASPPVWSMW